MLPLLDFPGPVLFRTCEHLDPASRLALRSTCKALNAPEFNAWLKRMTLDWRPTCPEPPEIVWPKTAPHVKTLVLVGGPTCGAVDNSELLGSFLARVCEEPHNAQLLHDVHFIHMKGWSLYLASRAESLARIMSRVFPLVNHLKLEGCHQFNLLLAHVHKHLTHVVHLEVHNASAQHGIATSLTVLPPALLTTLTGLSLVTPDTYMHRWDVTPLAAMSRLQQLELALPTVELEGLGAVSQNCTQLTQLRFVFSANDEPHCKLRAEGEHVAWPGLVEAHVLVPGDLLLQLGLHDKQTAPRLQLLNVSVIWPSVQTRATSKVFDAKMALFKASMCGLAGSSAFSGSLVIHSALVFSHALKTIAPLGSRLHHVAFCNTYRFQATDVLQLPCALCALPSLTRLTLVGVMGYELGDVAPLLTGLLNSQQITRVIIGLTRQNKDYLRGSMEAQGWFDMLTGLVGGPAVPAQVRSARGLPDLSPAPWSLKGLAASGGKLLNSFIAALNLRNADDASAVCRPLSVPHLYFGMWCPATDIDCNALEHEQHYLRLRQLAGRVTSAATGEFRLHECNGGSSADMALGQGAVWLEDQYEQLIQLGCSYWREEMEESESDLDEDDNDGY